MALTPKQSRFVAEFLVDLNATQAAIRTGYSPKSAKVTGCRLLTNANVAAAIAKAQVKRAERVGLTQDQILTELKHIGSLDVGEAFQADGRLKRLSEMPEHVRRSIAAIEVVEYFEGSGEDREQVGWVKKVRFWDKPRGLELSGKHLGMFVERLEHSGGVNVNVQINRVVKGS